MIAMPTEEYETWFWECLEDLRTGVEGFYVNRKGFPYFVAGKPLEAAPERLQ